MGLLSYLGGWILIILAVVFVVPAVLAFGFWGGVVFVIIVIIGKYFLLKNGE